MTTAPVDVESARRDYAALVDRGLSLDITRGKPSPRQLDLADGLLALPGDVRKAEDGTDVRNYGGLKGLPELRRIFAGPLQVPAEQLLAAGNSSLELMHDSIVQAFSASSRAPSAAGPTSRASSSCAPCRVTTVTSRWPSASGSS